MKQKFEEAFYVWKIEPVSPAIHSLIAYISQKCFPHRLGRTFFKTLTRKLRVLRHFQPKKDTEQNFSSGKFICVWHTRKTAFYRQCLSFIKMTVNIFTKNYRRMSEWLWTSAGDKYKALIGLRKSMYGKITLYNSVESTSASQEWIYALNNGTKATFLSLRSGCSNVAAKKSNNDDSCDEKSA